MPGASSERSSAPRARSGPPLVVILLLLVALSSTWLAHDEPGPPAPPKPDEVLDLPEFNATDHLMVVDGTNSSFAELLTLGCLQGLVNRELSRVYIDREGELDDPDSLLNFVLWRYNLTSEVVVPGKFLADFAHHARGLVVYDPGVPDTINVARTVAGLQDLLVMDPERASDLSDLTGLEVELDLREGKWKGLADLELYREAFDTFYVKADHRPLLGSRPEVELMTDFGVALGAFFYYQNPGPFTTPGEMALLEHYLKESAPGVPLLGWFDQPTGVEENYLVQKASAYGHFLLGGYRLPNFSCLTAYGRGDLTPPPAIADPPTTPELEAKTYLSFAVSDGDNIEFFTRRGRHIWEQPHRGGLPLTWSVSPALAELAPPLLERAYLEATANDTFIAGPSGLGYFYPGFLPDGHLEPILERTRSLMNESHLDSVWLLNSFTTYETPYDDDDLERYVDELGPSGILIDYGDVPVTVPFWQEGDTPVIRVFHLWGSVENLEAKLTLAMSENDPADTGQPYFVVVALMSIDFDLDEIWEVYSSLPDDVKVVALPAMFELVEDHWEEKNYDEENWHLWENPYGTDDNSDSWEHYEEFREGKRLHDRTRLVLHVILLMVPIALIDRYVVRSKPKKRVITCEIPAPLLGATCLTSLWVVGLSSTDDLLRTNFWHYGWLVPGLVGAIVASDLLDNTNRLRMANSWRGAIAATGLMAGIGLFGLHPLGYLLLLPAVALAARYCLVGYQPPPTIVVGSLMVALVVLTLPVQQGYWIVWAAALVAGVGLANVFGNERYERSASKNNNGRPSTINLLIAASSLTLATLPWYLDRSFFWANHAFFHMEWLAGMGLLTPLIGLLMFGILIRWTAREKMEVEVKLTSSGTKKNMIVSTRLPPSLLVLLVGLAGYLAAATFNQWFISGLMLLMAETCWLASAYLALRGSYHEKEAPNRVPPSFFLLVLALQALLALWLTIPPVFYAAFAWPGMPVWVNYLLYHTPLALAVIGLLVLLAALGRRLILDIMGRAGRSSKVEVGSTKA